METRIFKLQKTELVKAARLVEKLEIGINKIKKIAIKICLI